MERPNNLQPRDQHQPTAPTGSRERLAHTKTTTTTMKNTTQTKIDQLRIELLTVLLKQHQVALAEDQVLDPDALLIANNACQFLERNQTTESLY